MKRSIIKIRDMSFKFDDKYLFNNFNLDIYEGSFVSIIGKNASGKTTFAKILLGLYKADGYININGYLLNNYFVDKIKRNLSICLSDTIFYDTVSDCLAFSLENLRYTRKEINVLIDSISRLFNIVDLLNKSFDELTSSQKGKVLIAAALIHNPKIIFLDNILSMLLPSDKKSIIKILKDYQKKYHLTIIITTNDLEDTLYSDSVIVIDKGEVKTEGTLDEIYKDDTLEKLGFELPFIVKLSHNLILYDLLDKVYFSDKGVLDKLWD